MKKKKTISYILSISFGLIGILFLVSFINGRHDLFALVIGMLLIFIVVYNIIVMLKYSK